MDVYYLHFDTIDSTSTWAKDHAQELDPKRWTCITATTQTAGRGRFSRKWTSKAGNLHMTLFFCLDARDPRISNLAQLITFATAQLLLKETLPVKIKWPNDLMVEGKKLCGALVETVQLEQGLGIVVGLGMNVNAPVQTDQPTTSLLELTSQHWDLKLLRNAIISHFHKVLEMPFSSLVSHFENLLAFKGEKVRCYTHNETIEGILIGISNDGCLRIQTEKEIVSITSGDIEQLRRQQI